MSKKSWFKGLKKKTQQSEPRAHAEIKKEYDALCVKAGELQYFIEVKKAELNNLNQRTFEVNKEAQARKQLDAQAAAEASTKQQVETSGQ